MRPTVTGVRHLKIWVGDLAAAQTWYERVLGLTYQFSFHDDDGVVRGVAMALPGTGLQIGLRHDPERAQAMAAADPFALRTTIDELDAWVAHLDTLGVPHSPVNKASAGYAVAFSSPDGLQVKLYADDDTVRAATIGAYDTVRSIPAP